MTTIIDPARTENRIVDPRGTLAGPADGRASRRRGRPLEMTPEGLLERIRQLAERDGGLFQVHRSHSGLYARARRQFGSWSEAVRRAGVDYEATIESARARSLLNRKRLGRSRRYMLAGQQPRVDAHEEDFGRS